MIKSIFVYGTLMFESVMRIVTGKAYTLESASLDGYARYSLMQRNYPGIIAQTGQTVKGGLYNNVDANSLARLDNFEGNEYTRKIVRVQSNNNLSLDAYAYIISVRSMHLIKNSAWDSEVFKHKHLDQYLQHVSEVMRDYL